ncbi:hypothetical protein B0H12DRAFT_1121954 [Mycena haematopus]|nr:hypothetical protein B0H12DRAFT_1121954 [Mycena haematopus]
MGPGQHRTRPDSLFSTRFFRLLCFFASAFQVVFSSSIHRSTLRIAQIERVSASTFLYTPGGSLVNIAAHQITQKKGREFTKFDSESGAYARRKIKFVLKQGSLESEKRNHRHSSAMNDGRAAGASTRRRPAVRSTWSWPERLYPPAGERARQPSSVAIRRRPTPSFNIPGI